MGMSADVGLEPSGPEDLLLEELVRNWKWAAQQRHNMRDDDDVGLVFGDEEDQQPAFRQQQPVVSKAEQKQRQRQHPFAYRPRDPEFNGIQLSQQDDVISGITRSCSSVQQPVGVTRGCFIMQCQLSPSV